MYTTVTVVKTYVSERKSTRMSSDHGTVIAVYSVHVLINSCMCHKLNVCQVHVAQEEVCSY